MENKLFWEKSIFDFCSIKFQTIPVKQNAQNCHGIISEVRSETIFEMVNQFANYEKWVGKSFLLLAKNYVEQDDLFQAKLTLQNVVDNYQDEIQKQAQAELKKIEKFEAFSNAE